MYLVCKIYIKPPAGIVFDPDCPKRRYGINCTVDSFDKITISLYVMPELHETHSEVCL